MTEVVGERPRVKFSHRREGPRDPAALGAATDLAEAVLAMEALGCCPVLDDGLSAGNGALCFGESLLVSPSGRRPGACPPTQVVQVTDFDAETWTAIHRGEQKTSPTSDSPLYWAALVDAPTALSWPQRPLAALHGHVLDTERAAELLDLPLSHEATEFSTPPDRAALWDLMARFPYPAHRVWIRRGHGFFLLAPDLGAALEDLEALARRAAALGLLPADASD